MFASVPVEFRTLFLGDLSIYCNEQIIQEVFSRFGIIEQIRLKNASMNNELSYAFVTYVYRNDAEIALRQLQGTMLLGRKIRLGWATPKTTNGKSQKSAKVNPDNLSTAQIHFSFIAKNAFGIITEETIRDLFGSFGKVLDVAMKKSEIDHKQNVQSGYGFLHYEMSMEGIMAAINATNYVQKISINNVRYDSCLTRSLQAFVDENPVFSQRSHSRRPAPVMQQQPMQTIQSHVFSRMAFQERPVFINQNSQQNSFKAAAPSTFPQYQFSSPVSEMVSEDLDISSEILSLTESDSESASQPDDSLKSSNYSSKLESLSFPDRFESKQFAVDPSPFDNRDWVPTQVQLTTYGSSALSYSANNSNPTSFIPSSHSSNLYNLGW